MALTAKFCYPVFPHNNLVDLFFTSIELGDLFLGQTHSYPAVQKRPQQGHGRLVKDTQESTVSQFFFYLCRCCVCNSLCPYAMAAVTKVMVQWYNALT